jgi:hypothetical protein
MMAGKHISVTRIAGTTTKFMGNGGQHGAAVGVAAALCLEHDTTPRGLYEGHLAELQEHVSRLTGCHHLHVPLPDAVDPVTMTARETAERHARDVVDADLAAVMGDFFGSSLMALVAIGALPPNPTTAWEILSEDDEGDAVTMHVRYSNDTESLELETRWEQVAGRWMIVRAEKIRAED